ncbi:efflux RND transporter permease subunit [Caldalkalibacillus salinus]|uniref:efflux RND transporter permease subunit n=1 Tax=Caldalkalibacillus salinus TaxID=2803787 RepID=UPI001923E8CE|nr:efflux RND transporter permease subunit [Caldalkalibacillus salinus]
MKLLEFILQRKIIVGFLAVFILIFGLFAAQDLKIELMPDMTFDGASVQVHAGDESAVNVEQFITAPLEQSILALKNVDSVTSQSSTGLANIRVTFLEGTGDEAYRELESVVRRLQPQLPFVQEMLVQQFSMDSAYSFFIDVEGSSMDEMSQFVHDELKPRLESLREVSDVRVVGDQTDVLQIQLIEDRLAAYQLTPQQVIQSVQNENQLRSLGQVSVNDSPMNLRWDTRKQSIDEFKDMRIQTGSTIVTLEEIADVTQTESESSTRLWKNGDDTYISVQVGRSSDATDFQLTEAVRGLLDEMESDDLMGHLTVEELTSKGDYIGKTVYDVQTKVAVGGILAILLILLFLRNFRATLVIAVAIPSSVLLTLATVWVLDYSINVLTIIGLGLGIGMMVDTAIVMLESIYRKLEQGQSKFKAVTQGIKEVYTAIISATLTTIVVFLPIGMLSGEVGEFTFIMSIVIVIALLSSVFVSFTLIPVLAQQWIKKANNNDTASSATSSSDEQLSSDDKLKSNDDKPRRSRRVKKEQYRLYTTLTRGIVNKKRYRWLTIFLFVMVFVASIFLIPNIPQGLMPDVYDRQAELILSLEEMLSLEEQTQLADDLHQAFDAHSEIEDYLVNILDPKRVYLFINMTPEENATLSQTQVKQDIHDIVDSLKNDYPIQAVADAIFAGGGGAPIQVMVQGHDLDTLRQIGDDIATALDDLDGFSGVNHTLSQTNEELLINIDEEALSASQLTSAFLLQQLNLHLGQETIDEVTLEGRTHPVVLTSDQKIEEAEDVTSLLVTTQAGVQDMSDFLALDVVPSPIEISRHDGMRSVVISADDTSQDLGQAQRDVQDVIASLEIPENYTVSTLGQLADQEETFTEILFIVIVALLLVYCVMAVQFNHLAHPFIVMSIVPLTFVGALFGLFVTQKELNAMSAVGVVILIGIVLNNAILLIDRTKQLKLQGLKSEEALVEAGRDRLRPIMMTALTTAAGMLPMAISTGGASHFQSPLAVVMIFGLLVSTLITLLLIPAIYMVYEDILKRVQSMFRRRSATDSHPVKQQI